MYTKYLIFKSIQGLDKPWLVFTPAERSNPPKHNWEIGFATWREAIDALMARLEA